MTVNRRLLMLPALFGACLYSNGLLAADELDSSIWLSYGTDDADSSQQSIFMSLAMSENTTLISQLGRNRSSYQFTLNPENPTPIVISGDIETSQFYLGLSDFSLDPVSIDVGLEYSGSARELEFRIFKFGLKWFGDNVQLGLNYEYREIDLYTRTLPPPVDGQRRIEISSNGIGPVIGISGKHWSWTTSGMWYDYDKDPQNLFSYRNLIAFGGKRQNQAASAYDYYANSSLRYSGTGWSTALNYSQSVAAIDQAKTNTASLSVELDFAKRYTIELEAGRAFEEQDIESDFYSISFGVKFNNK